MRFHRKSLTRFAMPALAVLALGAAAAQFTSAAHHVTHAALAVYVAPAPLDAMEVQAVSHIAAVRKAVAREVRAEARARREHAAVLLAIRQRALAVQAAR